MVLSSAGDYTPIFSAVINWGYHRLTLAPGKMCPVSSKHRECTSKGLKHLFVHYLLLFHLPCNGNCQLFDSWSTV